MPDFTILMYHRVLNLEHSRENHLPAGMVTLESTFDKQMKYLKENFNVISLETLIACLKDKKNVPPHSVVLTFDDGWRDNYLWAFPILRKYNLTATIFLSTDYIDTSKMFWFQAVNFILASQILTPQKITEILNRFEQIPPEDKRSIVQSFAFVDLFIERLKRIKPDLQENIIKEMIKESNLRLNGINRRRWMLDWGEIKEMGENQISFGSHGHSHRILSYLDLTEIKKELSQSKTVIEEKTKGLVNSFAYPNGDFTFQIKELVKESGYLCACAVGKTEKKWDEIDLFALPRVGIHEGMSTGIGGKFSKALFACHIAGFLIRGRKEHE